MCQRIGRFTVSGRRVAACLIGLAVLFTVVLGPVRDGVAAVGDPLKLGQATNNAQAQLTGLKATVDTAVLRLTNAGAGAALDLRVPAGVAPLKVNSDRKVTNLNADLLDNVNIDRIVTDDTPTYAVQANASSDFGGGGETFHAFCDDGDRLQSGGYVGVSANGAVPSSFGEEDFWQIALASTNGNDASVAVRARCYDFPPFH